MFSDYEKNNFTEYTYPVVSNFLFSSNIVNLQCDKKHKWKHSNRYCHNTPQEKCSFFDACWFWVNCQRSRSLGLYNYIWEFLNKHSEVNNQGQTELPECVDIKI